MTVEGRIPEADKAREKTNFTSPAKDDDRMRQFEQWFSESESGRMSYEKRWADNLKLVFGIWKDTNKTRSDVRKRDKTYFRKIWAVEWRLTAAFFAAFMRDPDIVRVEGRDTLNDWMKAGVLEEMVKYRNDIMYRTQNLFLKHIWAFQDILNYGFCAGKMRWVYNTERNIDGPDFVLYPPEQVGLDFSAETEDKMRFCFFINYMTIDEMKTLGYKNVDPEKLSEMSIPYNQVRAVRHSTVKDPQQVFGEDEYPAPGSIPSNLSEKTPRKRYRVIEWFWMENGKKMLAVTNDFKVMLREPEDSPYGDRYPVVFGQCLTVAHRLIGEGLPQPLEGPQESYNYNLNIRKDNIALGLAGMHIVNRYGGVDLKSLLNARTGGIVLADDTAAVQKLETADITQSAYNEAAADEEMMQEMSGVNATTEGLSTVQKATVAQINNMNSNAKIDLFIGIVGETYWRNFHATLAYQIQKFETDEKVFRIANQNWQKREELPSVVSAMQVDSVDDFDADVVVYVGPGTVGRQYETQQMMMMMDRAVMANNSLLQLAVAGVVNPQQLRFFDLSVMMQDLLPKLGKKAVEKYFIKGQMPIPPQGGEGQPGANPAAGFGQAVIGKSQPQIGGEPALPEEAEANIGNIIKMRRSMGGGSAGA